MSQIHRFVPRRADAHRENIIAAVMGAIIVPAVFYFSRGERNVGVLLGSAVGVAVLIMVGYSVRARISWIDAIELSPEGATLEMKGKRRTLSWADVKSIRHGNRAGVHWVLTARKGLSMTIRGDGLNNDECRQIGELISGYTAQAALSSLVRA
ncbi:MAG TPA: hypothetical protein VK689_05680 [Armatimonadota bacterium]|nr:hypothetical protein [Armatimonadota bacterium]